MVNIIAWCVVFAFIAITVLTILTIFKIQPFYKWIDPSPEVESKLFFLLIVEIVGLCMGVAATLLNSQVNLVKIEKVDTQNRLNLSLEAWHKASVAWLNEPSGLSASGLISPQSNSPLIIGVDDEESAVFVLDVSDMFFPLVRSRLDIVDGGGKPAAHDLESITYDGARYYYALGSHRQTGNRKGASRTRSLVQFEITPGSWEAGANEIPASKIVDLTNLPAGLDSLGTHMATEGIDDIAWSKVGEPPNMFAVEIEGMAYTDNALLVGLKWPLSNSSAMLFKYAIDTSELIGPCRLLLPDSDGETYHGVSALSVSGSTLLLASNPPQKSSSGVGENALKYFGRSILWRFDLDDLDFTVRSCGAGITGRKVPLGFTKTDSKLEGVAFIPPKAFLAFDGDSPAFEIIDVPHN